MKKLFMIGMGGSIKNSTIEVHDMQFAICETKEEAFNIVKEKWYGDTLHIDSYTGINYINGYEIDLNDKSDKELFMVVYGGYKEGTIDELHDYNFILADSINEAKSIAKNEMSNYNNMDHIDSVVNIFELLNTRFGFVKSSNTFRDNLINHTYIKIPLN